MKSRLLAFTLSLILLGICFQAESQNDNWPIGADHAGMGYTGVAYGDIWGTYYNQASLAGLNSFSMGAFFRNTFNVQELGVKAASFAMPVFNGVAGAAFTHFGYSGYSETKFGLAYAMQLGKTLSAGIQLDYVNTHIANEFGNQGTPTGEVGIRFEPLDNLVFGAHVYNPFRAKLSGYDNQRLPTIFRAGLSYLFAGRFLLTVEGNQDMQNKTVLRAGAQFYALNHVYLRGGFSTNPDITHFGIGVEFAGVQANIAFSRHPVLDYTSHIGIAYKLENSSDEPD